MFVHWPLDATVQAAVDEVQATLGEKVVVRRVVRVAGEHVDVYLHKVNKDLPPQVGVLVATDKTSAFTRERIVQACDGQGLRVVDYFDSPIAGGDGNREFFVFIRKPA